MTTVTFSSYLHTDDGESHHVEVTAEVYKDCRNFMAANINEVRDTQTGQRHAISDDDFHRYAEKAIEVWDSRATADPED